MSREKKGNRGKPNGGPESEKRSDESPAASDSAANSSSEASVGTKAKPVRKRRWLRRTIFALAAVAVVCVVLRIVLAASLSTIIEKAANGYNLTCQYERLDISILSGDVELWHMVVAPKDGGEAFLSAEYCRGDVAIASLLMGKLVVRRVELDGADLTIDRNADGSFALLRCIQEAGGAVDHDTTEPEPEAADEDEASDDTAAIALSPPIEINALRVQHVQTRFRDQSVEPPIDTECELSLRLSNLNSPTHPLRFDLDISAEPLLDQMYIEGMGRTAVDALELELAVTLRGLHPRAAAGYLRPLGVEPVAEEIAAALDVTVNVDVSADKMSEATADLVVSDVHVEADGVRALELGRARIDVGTLSRTTAGGIEITVSGGKCFIERPRAGVLRIAGVDLVPAPKGPQTQRVADEAASALAPGEATPAVESPAVAAASGDDANDARPVAGDAESKPRFLWSIASLGILDHSVRFVDASVEPNADLEFSLVELAVENVTNVPEELSPPTSIAVRATAPGLFQSLDIRGRATLFVPEQSLTLALDVSGIAPDAAAPYLAAAGIESALDAGTLSLRVDAQSVAPQDDASGSTKLSASVSELSFRDGESELFALDRAGLAGVSFRSEPPALSIDEIAIAGTRVRAARDPDAALRLFGLRLGGAATEPHRELEQALAAEGAARVVPVRAEAGTGAPVPAVAPGTAETAVGDAATPSLFPLELRVGRTIWEETRVLFTDYSTPEVVELAVEDLGVEIGEWMVNPSAPSSPPSSAPLRLWVNAPGIARRIEGTGTFTPSPSSVEVALAVEGRGIDAKGVGPYLSAAGLESRLDDGSLDLELGADVQLDSGAVVASVDLERVVFRDGDEEWAGVDAVRCRVRAEPTRFVVENVEIERPRLAATRSAGGDLTIAGIGVLPVVETTDADAASSRSDTTATASAPRSAAPGKDTHATEVSVERVHFGNATLRWVDEAISESLGLTAEVDFDLGQLLIADGAEPAPIDIRLRAPSAVEELRLHGTVGASPHGFTTRLDLDATGLTGETLARYVDGVEPALKNGRAHAELRADVLPRDGGGWSAAVAIENVSLGEDGADPIVALAKVSVSAPRIDPENGVHELEEISMAGLAVDAVKRTSGAIEVAGLSFPPAPAEEDERVAEEATDDGGAEPPSETLSSNEDDASGGAKAEGGPSGAENGETIENGASSVAKTEEDDAKKKTAALAARLRERLPTVSLGKLDLHVERLSFVDESVTDRVPLRVADVRIATPAETTLLNAEPTELPPIEIGVTGRVEPLVGSFEVKTRAAPFSTEPTLNVDVAASAIDLTDLPRTIAGLAEVLGDGAMTAGEFSATLETTVKAKRTGPLDFAFKEGLGLETNLAVALRESRDGEVLAGFENLRVDVASIDPSGRVHIRDIELTKPEGRVRKSEQGFHVLGLVLRTPEEDSPRDDDDAEGEPEAEGEEEIAAADEVESAGDAQDDASADADAPEIRIDRVIVSGIDFALRDETVDPPASLPITGLDVEVRKFSNRMFTEERTLAFNASLEGGEIPLPKRLDQSALFGAIADAVKVVAGDAETKELEDRAIFGEIGASGRLAFFPEPKGWAKARIDSLELGSLSSFAAASGVQLDDGVLDAKVDVRLLAGGDMKTRAGFTFTDLQLSEPPDGPIFRYLHLPAPLDTVIFVLRDEDGSIHIPLNFALEQGQISNAEIAKIATTTLGSVIADALASAPLRVASVATDLIPLPFGGEDELVAPATIEFEAGAVAVGNDAPENLAPIIEQMRDDETISIKLTHSLGSSDLTAISAKVNLSEDESRAIVHRLRTERTEWVRERARLAAEVRAALASGTSDLARRAMARLREVDREIGETDRSLDRILEQLAPGAPRRAPRRTRAGCVRLAEARLAALREQVLAELGPDVPAERVDAGRPRFQLSDGTTGRIVVTPKRKSAAE